MGAYSGNVGYQGIGGIANFLSDVSSQLSIESMPAQAFFAELQRNTVVIKRRQANPPAVQIA